MRGVGKRRRALGAALLLSCLTIGAPALSAAQDAAPAPGAPVEPSGTPPAAPAAPPAAPTPAPQPAPLEAEPQEQAAGGGEAATQAPAAAPATAPAEPAAPVEGNDGGKKARAAASATVSTGDNFYSPATISVFAGDTVTWTNNGAAQHSATADDGSFDTGIFRPGQNRSQTFSSPGTFSYFCTVHGQSQSGTVRVLAASDSPSGGSASSGPSEAAAVAAADAAGTSTSLPATGLPLLLLAAVGMALLGSGILAGRAADSE